MLTCIWDWLDAGTALSIIQILIELYKLIRKPEGRARGGEGSDKKRKSKRKPRD